MSTIHYLQWHHREPFPKEEAGDLFYEFHYDPPDALSSTTFDDLYVEVTEVEERDLEEIYAGWNRGSGRESEQFLELRYCEWCKKYIDGVDKAVNHGIRDHGYYAPTDFRGFDYIHGIRSMSVGDIVERDQTYYACASIGWECVDVLEDSMEDDEGDTGSA